jgi:hypothetical protein
MSAFGGKADIVFLGLNVCLRGSEIELQGINLEPLMSALGPILPIRLM